ncbi:hypothetical protein STIUS_v1c01150 [Spiroplasma sp. TIUS-1]|nr:hypothetical protein STIUS_v1c01150 [Spiroplasma sp. TIUS-1]
MKLTNVINIQKYLIAELSDVIDDRIEWLSDVLGTENLSV